MPQKRAANNNNKNKEKRKNESNEKKGLQIKRKHVKCVKIHCHKCENRLERELRLNLAAVRCGQYVRVWIGYGRGSSVGHRAEIKMSLSLGLWQVCKAMRALSVQNSLRRPLQLAKNLFIYFMYFPFNASANK